MHVESGPLLTVVDRCRSTIIERVYAEAQGQPGTPGADLTIDATTGVRCYQSQTTTLGS